MEIVPVAVDGQLTLPNVPSAGTAALDVVPKLDIGSGQIPASSSAPRRSKKKSVIQVANPFNGSIAIMKAPTIRSSMAETSSIVLVKPSEAAGDGRRSSRMLARTGSDVTLRRSRRGGIDMEEELVSGQVSRRLDMLLRQCTPWPNYAQMKSVKKFNFSGMGLVEADVRTLPELHRHTPYLTALELSHNRLGPSWTAVFAAAFEHTMDLAHLELYGCGLTDTYGLNLALEKTNITNASGCQLSFGLKSLNLGNNRFAPEGLEALPLALKQAPELQSLNLERNLLGQAGSFAIVPAFQFIYKLTTLNLNECRIGPRGVIGIAQGLAYLKELRELYMSCNNIGPGGVQELVEPLKFTRHLEVLDLGWNKLGQEGVQVLALALLKTRHVQRLVLGGNGLDPSAERELQRGLVQIANGTLQPALETSY